MGQKIPVEIFGTWSLTDVGGGKREMGSGRETDSGSETEWVVAATESRSTEGGG